MGNAQGNVNFDNYRTSHRRNIAEGGFGFVTEVVDEKGNRFAMKRVIVPIDDTERNKVALNEQVVLASLPNHPNVVHFNAACQIDVPDKRQRHYCTLMEYCEGNVWDAMVQYKNKGEKFSERQICAIFRDACLAIHHLHTQMPPIAHRDLKVENLLFGLDGNIKLTDFGSCTTTHGLWTSSRDIKAKEEEISKHTTLAYRSPEQVDLYLQKKVSEKADIWALGVLLFVLTTDRTPFCDAMGNVEKLGILNARFSFPLDWAYSQGLRDFVLYLLNPDPDERPSIHDVLSYGATQKASGALPNWPGLPSGSAIWPCSDPDTSSQQRKSMLRNRQKRGPENTTTQNLQPIVQAPITVSASFSPPTALPNLQQDEYTHSSISHEKNTRQHALPEDLRQSRPSPTTDAKVPNTSTGRPAVEKIVVNRIPNGKSPTQSKTVGSARQPPSSISARRTVPFPPPSGNFSTDSLDKAYVSAEVHGVAPDKIVLIKEGDARWVGARTDVPKPTIAGLRGTISDKARQVGGSLVSIISHASRLDGEQETLSWVRKATNSRQPGFPKAKHLRYIVVAIWEGQITIDWLLVRLNQRPWADSALVCCKVLVTFMKVMQQGPPHILSSYIKYVDFIDQVERHWKTFTGQGLSELQSSQIRCAKPNSAVMAIFICKFASLLRQKLHFHSFHPEFGSHFTTLAKLTGKETLPSNLTLQSIPGVLTRLLTIQGSIQVTQKSIFKVSATFDERTESIGSTNPTPEDAVTAQAALLPLIEESYVLFIACLHLLEALYGERASSPSAVAESVKSALRNQFDEQFESLQMFYTRCHRVPFVHNMDCIPELPKKIPLAQVSGATATQAGYAQDMDRLWDPFDAASPQEEAVNKKDSNWKSFIPLPSNSVDDVHFHFSVLEAKLDEGHTGDNEDDDFDPFCLYNKLPDAEDSKRSVVSQAAGMVRPSQPATNETSASSFGMSTSSVPKNTSKQETSANKLDSVSTKASMPMKRESSSTIVMGSRGDVTSQLTGHRNPHLLSQPPKPPITSSTPETKAYPSAAMSSSAVSSPSNYDFKPFGSVHENNGLKHETTTSGWLPVAAPDFASFDAFAPAKPVTVAPDFASFDAFAPVRPITVAPDFPSFDAFAPTRPASVNSHPDFSFQPIGSIPESKNLSQEIATTGLLPVTGPDLSSFDEFAPARPAKAASEVSSFDAFETTPFGLFPPMGSQTKNQVQIPNAASRLGAAAVPVTDNPFDAFIPPESSLATSQQTTNAMSAQVDAVYCPSLQPWRDSILHPSADPVLRSALSQCLSSFSTWGLDIAFDALDVEDVIGTGAFAVVYKGKIKSNGVRVAVKKLLSTAGQPLTAKSLKDFVAEADFMRTLRHPNIIDLLATCSAPICVLMDFCDRGNLMTVLQDVSLDLPSALRRSLMANIASGMAYLHSRNPVVIHRDLKSLNILITSDWAAKITDFGLSRLSAEADQNNMMTGQIGTFHWMAPEVISGTDYTAKADVYSFAIIAWEILTRESPYPGMHPVQIVAAVCNNNLRPPIPPDAPLHMKELISQCWNASPQHRPQFSEIYTRLRPLPKGFK